MSEVKRYWVPNGTLQDQSGWHQDDTEVVQACHFDAALAREAALREELDAIKRAGPPHFCGLPMSLNPHAEAGKPGRFLEVGAHRECIPCLVSSRHGWAKTAGELQQRLTFAEQLLSQVEVACDLAISAIDDDERGANFVKIIQAIRDKAALKLAADPAKPSANCPNCKVCMGLPEFPENCLINGIKP